MIFKLQKSYKDNTEFPEIPPPISPIVNIVQSRSTFVTTKKPTLVLYYQPDFRFFFFFFRFHQFSPQCPSSAPRFCLGHNNWHISLVSSALGSFLDRPASHDLDSLEEHQPCLLQSVPHPIVQSGCLRLYLICYLCSSVNTCYH